MSILHDMEDKRISRASEGERVSEEVRDGGEMYEYKCISGKFLSEPFRHLAFVQPRRDDPIPRSYPLILETQLGYLIPGSMQRVLGTKTPCCTGSKY